MRRVGSGGVTAALIVGLGLSVATVEGADNDAKPPVGKGLLSGLFHEKPRTQVKPITTPSEVSPQPATSTETVAAEQQRHMNALMRRMEVCDRLRMIANQTGNETLMSQADELEERANAIYRRQTAGLPLPAQAPLSVLASDRETPKPDPKATRANAPIPRPAKGVSNDTRRALFNSPARLGGSLDQREQSILNGTSMGEK